MPEIQIPVDLGFTEFVTTLLTEVVSSIVSAQTDQEQRVAELAAAAALPLEEFAAAHVAEEELDQYLATLFPPTADDRPHDAASGAPYQPAEDGRPEQPPFEQVLGVRLAASDVNVGQGRLRARGANKIRAAARLRFAAQQQDVAVGLLERGVPRVIVDAGRVSAKLTFEALQYREEELVAEPEEGGPIDEEEAVVAGVPRALAGAHDIVMVGRLPRVNVAAVVPRVLRDVRMRVRPADERKPETSARANVYGEVELTFKTVT